MAESFAAQQFLSSGEDFLIGWRDGNAEVEFVRVINGRIIPIEIRSGWVTQAKSLNILAKKYDPDFRVIMSAKPLNINQTHNVHHYPLYLARRFPLTADSQQE